MLNLIKYFQTANKYFVKGFYETSAKTNAFVEEAFERLAHDMVEIYNPTLVRPPSPCLFQTK